MNPDKHELNQFVSPTAFELTPELTSDDTDSALKRLGMESNMQLVDSDIPEFRLEQAEHFHRLYHAQYAQRTREIKRLYLELGQPEQLIVTLFCGKYLPLFRNWLLSCDRNDIPVRNRTLAFGLDTESARISKALGIKTYLIDPDVYLQAGHSDLFGDASFRRTMLYKNAVMLDALSLGARLLFQDTDLIWFKDPFPYLENDNNTHDIQIMYDGPHQLYKPLHANTGFIYFQPNDVNKAVLETALYNSASILVAGGHQTPFNQILNHFIRNRLLRVQVLPQHLFLNGHLFNLVRGVRAEAKNWEEDGIVLHYSWTGTMKEKLQKLHKFGFDFLDLTIEPEPQPIDTQVSDKNGTQSKETNGVSEDKKGEPGDNAINLTLHIAGQDALYLRCNRSAPILRTLFNTLLGQNKGGRNGLIHLQIDDDKGPKDIYLRTEQINGIETEPPLTADFLDSLGKKEVKRKLRAVRYLKRTVRRAISPKPILEELFEKHDYATDKLRAHSYIPVYDQIFRKRKNKASKVLEIGIGSGGSLQLWHDYFTNAEIYGIDLNYIHPHLDHFERIHQIKDDAYTARCIQKYFISNNIKFDIVIDDGPHTRISQMMAMELYFPLLTKDGVIVIEDVQDHHNPGIWIKDIIGSLPHQYQEHAKVVDLRHLNKSPDDLLIVLDKSGIGSVPRTRIRTGQRA